MKRNELEIGKIYQCQFSGFKMIINRKEEAKTTEGKDTLLVFARFFNSVTGKFEETNIVDGQLEKLEAKQKMKYKSTPKLKVTENEKS